MGHRPKGEQDGPALPLPGGEEFPPVTADHLIVVLVAIVEGQGLDGVRDANRRQFQLRAAGAEQRRVENRRKLPTVVPVVMFH